MNRILFPCIWISLFCVLEARDPFWPIDYTGNTPAPKAPEVEAAPTPEPSRELTDQELRRLAEQEASKIKEILDRKATAVFAGRVHALVNGKWVTAGDSLIVEALGNTYRLQIITLTTDNIELEPHRSAEPSSN